jgi:hypothetical protein
VPLLIVAFTVVVILAGIALTPLAVVQRYRRGTARRRASGWIATINSAGLAFSSALFLVGAGLTSLWVPNALTLSAMGFASGCLLGLVGLALSRWELTSGSLHYTPNRWLVLGITVVVTTRLAFGFWRSWHAWDSGSWAAESGVAGSLAAGAIVLGYYLTYWLGVRRRVRRHGTGRDSRKASA